ncbi:PREDICTED: uncharacterized protein LOC109472712 [Branchiostoma belcheri]|uniref:Uncharacterized protein LOC109472712 n=1 Tax=Branchiostoma belcheri TaxID=7741 RepID=A0A6P4Z2G8_BRABE|nr:PREDICTED: uncharacterized protein LOC109472712 [Branchiostoma belcheri]
MKLSVCLLFLGCLVLVTEAIPAPREEDLQGLLTELEDSVDELEGAVAEAGMEKRRHYAFRVCIMNCEKKSFWAQLPCKGMCEIKHGKRDEVGLEAEEEELQEKAFLA